MQLPYPLLFPFDDNGFHLNIPLHEKKNKTMTTNINHEHPEESRSKSTVLMREFYTYKLMIRPNESLHYLHCSLI